MTARTLQAGQQRLVTTRNAAFQQWQTLLTNRTKRHRAGELLVQGVRPVSLALEAGWQIRAVLTDGDARLSQWASEALSKARHAGAVHYKLASDLIAELGEKEDGAPEVLLVVAMPSDDLERIPTSPDMLAVALDRPTSPGNVGSITRSLDAFGGSGLIVTGHAADPYDPRAVRASTGSTFTVPTVRSASATPVLEWVEQVRASGIALQLLGTDERGDVELPDADLTRPTLILTGNETTGLASVWREACDVMVRIPIGGHASWLNAANATTVMLYEAIRQRRN